MPRRPVASAAARPVPLMMTIRRWHGYVGAIIAPAVLFFAFTGILQLFHLHESHGPYIAPPLLVQLGGVHKDQTLKVERHEDHGPRPGAPPRPPKPDEPQPVATYALKWLFTFVALGLISSTIMGLWIALQDPRRRRSTVVLFLIGAALPVVLLLV